MLYESKLYSRVSTGVNFINVLQAVLTYKVQKDTDDLTVFLHFWNLCSKNLRVNMLVKFQVILGQWFSTFLVHGTLICFQEFGGTLAENLTKILRKVLFFYMLCSVFQDLAAHLREFRGTLMCRGTPVEKHCSRVFFLLKYMQDSI